MNALLTTATATTTDRLGPGPTAIRQQKRAQPACNDFNRHSQVQTSQHPYLFICQNSGSNSHKRDASHHGRTDHFHSQSIPSLVYAPFTTDYSNHKPIRCKPPLRKNRPLPQSIPSLVYAPFATDFSSRIATNT
jgi:hypothetical protein